MDKNSPRRRRKSFKGLSRRVTKYQKRENAMNLLSDFFRYIATGKDQNIPIILLRHAKAIKRHDFIGDDTDRPLSELGEKQAEKIVELYQYFGLKEIHTSDALRCLKTVEKLAQKLELTPIVATELSEYVFHKKKEKSIDYVLHQFSQNKPVLICGHNPFLSKYFKKMVGKKWAKKFKEELEPGEAWVIYRFNGKVIRINLMQIPEV
jgi:8-oxo-dGTP diphosphatase